MSTNTTDAQNRDLYATRRALRGMTAELHRLERASREFDVRERQAKDRIEAVWSVEHWGRPPVHPPAWRDER